MIVGKKSLTLINLQDPENPLQMSFENRYGNIVSYQWYVNFKKQKKVTTLEARKLVAQ